VADSRMKGRVKGLLAGPPPESAVLDQPPHQTPHQPMPHDVHDPDAQRQALQVLVLAQRTADEHVAATQRQAEEIRSDARGRADQIVRDAQAHADATRRDADAAMASARAAAEQIVREAQAHADRTRHDAEKVMSDARAKATEIVKEARASADGLDREARQRYDEVVGSLEVESAELEQRIEALTRFDRDYRSRLRTFMNEQLRALDEGEPAAEDAEVADDEAVAANA
jgi:cell division septum initiation protein DivIVA